MTQRLHVTTHARMKKILARMHSNGSVNGYTADRDCRKYDCGSKASSFYGNRVKTEIGSINYSYCLWFMNKTVTDIASEYSHDERSAGTRQVA